jgi:HK97 family phage portal protein
VGVLGFLKKENRASIEDPSVPISNDRIISFFGLDSGSAAGEIVTIDSALGVPAIWAAVNFLSGTIAGLPLHVFKRSGEGRTRVNGHLSNLLNSAANDEMSSFDWLKAVFDAVFTGGRSVTFIERNKAGMPTNLWPLELSKLTIQRRDLKKQYIFRDSDKRTFRYAASEVIDISFMLRPDLLTARSPIITNAESIGLAQAVTKYGGRFFQNGGVPPFAIEGPFQSPGALQRSANDLADAVRNASKKNRLAISIPQGHSIKSIGVSPEKSQLVELQRFVVEQVARIYSLPPTFLQDLTNGTFSNTEQQDLHFVKHTLKRWVEQFEKELNLKLFGRNSNTRFVEFNLDGMLRGDFKARMEGYARGIQNAILKPNEVRRRENLPDEDGGDNLMIQSATVPVKDVSEVGDE